MQEQPLLQTHLSPQTDDDEDSSTKGGSKGANTTATTGAGSGSGISGKDAADAGAGELTAGLDDTAKLGSTGGSGGGKDVADDLERGETDQVRIGLWCLQALLMLGFGR
jgi:hypothetical protein